MFISVYILWTKPTPDVTSAMSTSDADPENCVRGGQTLTTFFLVDEGKGGSKYNYRPAIIDLPSKHL